MNLVQFDKETMKYNSYVKICQNKAHMGPISEEKVKKSQDLLLSAAANKVRTLSDFTVKVKINNNQDENSNKISSNKSWLIEGLPSDERDLAENALLILQAWNRIDPNIGSKSYQQKLSSYLEARAIAYMKVGINPNSVLSKPSLSAEQRAIYNSIVGPLGFDYYEYHIAYKQSGQSRMVRSKTFRNLRPMDVQSMLVKIANEVDKLKDIYIISSRQTN